MGAARFGRPSEAGAVVGRGGADPAGEGAAHGLGGAETAAGRDELDRIGGLLEELAGALHPQRLDVGRRGHPGLAPEEAGEVARAHRGAFGQGLDPQVGVEVVGDPGLELAQRPPLGELRREVGAELGLAAGALEEEDQPARDLQRDLAPRSSSTSARERSMPEVTPAEVQTSPSRTKIGLGSTLSSGWRRASSAVEAQWVVTVRPSSSPARASRKAPEQTEVTRRERRAALRIQRIRPASSSALATPKPPATTSVSIGPRQRAVVVLGSEPVTAGAGRDRPGLLGDHLDRVGAAAGEGVRAGEHLRRPDHVQRLDPREGEDDDASWLIGRGHGRIMALSAVVCNDQ